MESDVTDGQVSKIDFSETYDKDTDSSVIGDPKDLIIKSLQEEKESLILEIKALKLEWAREKDLNNVLLEERRLRQQLENTTNNTVPSRVSAREFPGREIPGIPVKFTFPFPGKNAIYPGNSRSTHQVTLLKIVGSEWKYKLVKLH